MPEKYKPSEEEIQKAENTMKKLGLEKRSKAEQDAFEAGRSDLLEMTNEEREQEKLIFAIDQFVKKFGLSDKIRNLFIEKHIECVTSGNFDYSTLKINSREVKESDVLECIEKIQEIGILDVEAAGMILTIELAMKFFEKFPNATIRGARFALVDGSYNVKIFF